MTIDDGSENASTDGMPEASSSEGSPGNPADAANSVERLEQAVPAIPGDVTPLDVLTQTAEPEGQEPAVPLDSVPIDIAATLGPRQARVKVESTGQQAQKMEWFVVHAYSGFEMKAKQALEERIRQHKMQDLFGDIHVPEETVVELVRGQKKTSMRKFFPGYMLVQMVLNEDTWHLVKETPKITGFVGDAREPQPVSEEEIQRVRSQVEEGATSPRARMNFEQGEAVKVIDGPFADFNGTVEEVKPEKGKVKVLISIFGRATPVELDFVQIEKC